MAVIEREVRIVNPLGMHARPAAEFVKVANRFKATIAVGRITGIDTSAATAVPGVLDVLTYRNAPRLAAELDLDRPARAQELVDP